MAKLYLVLVMLFSVGAWASSPLVSGNGFGYAVVDGSGTLTKFYAHPYRFKEKEASGADGIPTVNLISQAHWAQDFDTSYLAESHIVRAGKATYFLPFGLERNVLVTVGGGSNCLNLGWEYTVKKHQHVVLDQTAVELFQFDGTTSTVVVIPIQDPGTSVDVTNYCASGWAFIALEENRSPRRAVQDFNKWRLGLTSQQLVDRELSDLEAWRVPLPALRSPNEQHLWRQSEVILRMAQIREPNRPGRHNYGLINASLPDGVWFIPWVRDMAFSVVGLVKMGHQAEARMGLNALLNTEPMHRMSKDVRGVPYQISTVRYFGDGSEDADFSGQPYQNLEFDSWGLAMWAMGEYFEAFHDVSWLSDKATHGKIYGTAKDYIAEALLGNLDVYRGGTIVAQDSSIWEQNHMPRQHYAYSTLMAIAGLRNFIPIAEAAGDGREVRRLRRQVLNLEHGFDEAFVHNDIVYGTLEGVSKNDMDGSLLEGIVSGTIHKPEMIRSTLDRLEMLHTGSGGYRRVTGTTPYESHEFLFVNFMFARGLLRLGQRKQADALVKTMVDRSVKDHGFVPELYVSFDNPDYPGAIGDPAGAIPMVGYGAGIYMIYLAERELFR